MTQPVAYDFYCGLGGWAEGFLAEGFYVIGYDIEKHDYGTGTYPGELRLRDVLDIDGRECKDATVFVASPPCQEPSYRAMPWKRAKALNAAGPPHKFIALFEACFRIQREASEAAGHHIPLIVENVVGAQRWVGRAKWHFGSYYLWGDVPALIPSPSFHGHENELSVKTALEIKGFNGIASGRGNLGKNQLGRLAWSTSNKRKQASAEIAKIPFPLALHVARCFKPVLVEAAHS